MQCLKCGAEFFKNRGNRKFCSNSCATKHWLDGRPDYSRGERQAKVCRRCEQQFETTNARMVFCSHECKIAYHNANRETSKPHKVICHRCGVAFWVKKKSGIGKRYCSRLCAIRERKSKHHPLRIVFDGMWSRCTNQNSSSYDRYGAKGIKVCERWRNFENFVMDMGEKPSPKHSIDRIDNDDGYNPDNCRWATRKEQSRNRRCVLLDQNMANTINELYRLGKTPKQISQLMALPYNTVLRVTSGKTWRNE